jgi:hypothetical protein
LKYPIERRWQCPQCGRQETTSGQVTSRACTCGPAQVPPRTVWMRLLEEEPPPLAMPKGVVPRTWKKVTEPRQPPPGPPPPAAARARAEPLGEAGEKGLGQGDRGEAS